MVKNFKSMRPECKSLQTIYKSRQQASHDDAPGGCSYQACKTNDWIVSEWND